MTLQVVGDNYSKIKNYIDAPVRTSFQTPIQFPPFQRVTSFLSPTTLARDEMVSKILSFEEGILDAFKTPKKILFEERSVDEFEQWLSATDQVLEQERQFLLSTPSVSDIESTDSFLDFMTFGLQPRLLQTESDIEKEIELRKHISTEFLSIMDKEPSSEEHVNVLENLIENISSLQKFLEEGEPSGKPKESKDLKKKKAFEKFLEDFELTGDDDGDRKRLGNELRLYNTSFSRMPGMDAKMFGLLASANQYKIPISIVLSKLYDIHRSDSLQQADSILQTAKSEFKSQKRKKG